MSNYWTEETITTVQCTYIKGTFTGKYHAEKRSDWSHTHSELYDMHIYHAEVTIEEIHKDEQGPFPEAKNLRPFKGSFAQPVNCFDPVSNTYFQLTLDEPHIDDPKLSKVTREGNEQLGTISGTIYGHLTKLQTQQVKTEHLIAEKPTINNDWSDWTRTATHEFSMIEGSRYRRDYYRHTGGARKWGSWYAVNDRPSFLSVLKVISGIFFAVLLLAALIGLSWPGLIILGFILFMGLLAKVRRTGFGTAMISFFYGSILLLYLLGMAIAIFRSFPKPVNTISPTRENVEYTQVRPVKQHTDVKQPADSDVWIIHHRSWTDISGNTYEGDVKVLKSQFQSAKTEHDQLQEVTGLSDVYRDLSLADEARLKGVYPLFDSLRKADRLDSIGFANMLVSFVQDIPYSKVTDGTCNDTNNNLSQSFSPTVFDCIGGIPYGVQSPVEFMTNFQGDCDTRTLFLFTLFNHYGYHVSILGSEAFRHSLLGLELPLNGAYKIAGSKRYVLWETTGKGFAAGYLSPEIDHMDYWNFYLINSPSS